MRSGGSYSNASKACLLGVRAANVFMGSARSEWLQPAFPISVSLATS